MDTAHPSIGRSRWRATGGRIGEWLPCLLAALIVAFFYFNDKARSRVFFSEEPDGYYGLLTEALPAGQTNLNIVADMRFLKLENPYAGPQDTIRPHDVSYYRGRFYIYYGITPVILMIPWLVATGHFLTEQGAIGIFCYGGFLLGLLLLVRVRKYSAPTISPWLLGLAVLVWGLGSPVFFLSQQATFYAVPIACAFCCLMGALVAVDSALRTTSPHGALVWLALGSLVSGLAVGARPIYLAGLLPLLLTPSFVLWRRHAQPAGRHGLRRVLLAALVPAGLVGMGLAWYNYARFGNPLEFGIRYSLASGDLRQMKMLGLEFIPKNLALYLTKPAEFIRYYPFVYNDYRPFGLLPHYTLACSVVLLPLLAFSRALRGDPVWPALFSVITGAAVANLLMLSLFFGEVDRYLVDFAPPALLGAIALLLWLSSPHVIPWPGLRRACLFGGCATALWTLCNGTAFGLALQPTTPIHARMEWIGNHMSYAIERLIGANYGPIEAEIVFPPHRPGETQRDPILSTGYLRRSGDILYAAYPDADHVQIGYFHLGAGGPISEPIAVERGRPYRLTVELGSLYPAPRRHPYFTGWNDSQIRALQRRLVVQLDNRVVIQAETAIYPSTPDGVRLAANDLAGDVSQPRFSGRISSVRRLPAPSPSDFDLAGFRGPVRLRLRLPDAPSENFQPLVSTGLSGAGDLLGIQVRPDGRLRFMHDCWGASPYYSESFERGEGPEQFVEIDMGSLYPSEATPGDDRQYRRLLIRLNGQTVVDQLRPFNPSRSSDVVFGYNAIQGGSVQMMFSGSIVAKESWSPPAEP